PKPLNDFRTGVDKTVSQWKDIKHMSDWPTSVKECRERLGEASVRYEDEVRDVLHQKLRKPDGSNDAEVRELLNNPEEARKLVKNDPEKLKIVDEYVQAKKLLDQAEHLETEIAPRTHQLQELMNESARQTGQLPVEVIACDAEVMNGAKALY